MKTNTIQSIILGILCLVGCGRVDKEIAPTVNKLAGAISRAESDIHNAGLDLNKVSGVLEGLSKQLEDETLRDQVNQITFHATQAANTNSMGFTDFVRDRILEDLGRMKAQVTPNAKVPERVPRIVNSAFSITFSSPGPKSVSVVGWNLDVAQRQPEKYSVVVLKRDGTERKLAPQFVAWQPYSITVNVSKDTGALEYEDNKISLKGFNVPLEILVLDSGRPITPPPAERITKITVYGHCHPDGDDKDVGEPVIYTVLRDDQPVYVRRWTERLFDGAFHHHGPDPDTFSPIALDGRSHKWKLRVQVDTKKTIDWDAEFRVDVETDRGRKLSSPMSGYRDFDHGKTTQEMEWTWNDA